MNLHKIKKSIRIGLVAVLFGGAGACTDHFDDLNTPSNRIVAENVDASLLGQALAQSQWSTMAGQYQQGQNLFADIYAQYFATTHRNFRSDQYQENMTWTNNWYKNFYADTAPQIYFVEQFTAENNMPLANAIAKVWRVYMYHRVADYFGPLIYSEFGSGKTSVAYDTQEAAYKDFFKTLDHAVAVLKQNAGKNFFASNDHIYEGSADKWLTFANSLRLRLAMRIVYADGALAQQEAEKAVAAGVMMSNADNAGVASTTTSINNLAQWTYLSEFRMSASMESVLKGYNDPRLSEYFNEAGDRLGGDGGYHGLRNGAPDGDRVSPINEAHSFVDDKWLPIADGGGAASEPSLVMTAAEVYFLRAEGALRGWSMGGTAGELYNEGIRTALLHRTNVSADKITAYINSTNTPAALNDKYNSPPMTTVPVLFQEGADFETKLEQIITQKWLAMYPDGREAWAERRRTGYPRGYAVVSSLNADIPTTGLVRRLKFVRGERSNNAVAVGNAETLLNGPDVNHTRVWWDAKPLGQFPTPTN